MPTSVETSAGKARRLPKPATNHRLGYNFRQAKKAAFLAVYAKSGNITLACDAAAISRSLYYDWTEKDQRFALAVQQARIEATERLEAEAYRRAHDGVKRIKTIYYLGEPIGEQVETQYSDLLMIVLLKALKPEVYRENVAVTQTVITKLIDAAAWDAV